MTGPIAPLAERPSRKREVGLVGKSFYQPAVRLCREGDAVELRHTPDGSAPEEPKVGWLGRLFGPGSGR